MIVAHISRIIFLVFSVRNDNTKDESNAQKGMVLVRPRSNVSFGQWWASSNLTICSPSDWLGGWAWLEGVM